MNNPLETLKSFVGLNQPGPANPTTSTTTTTDSPTIQPTSNPVEGDTRKTELQPSAPAVVPTRLATSVSEIEPAEDEIAISADAEAGISLNEVMPVRRGS